MTFSLVYQLFQTSSRPSVQQTPTMEEHTHADLQKMLPQTSAAQDGLPSLPWYATNFMVVEDEIVD